MSNYSKVTMEASPRVELHDKLGLTATEVSINRLPAGGNVPFVHSHKQNEELYIVLEGDGKFVIDGEDIALKAGDAVRIAPAGKRQIFAGENGLVFICIQAKAGSLEGFTGTDAAL